MTNKTRQNPHPETARPVKAESSKDETERLIDEAATLFAKLFLEQVLDNRRENGTSATDVDSHAEIIV